MDTCPEPLQLVQIDEELPFADPDPLHPVQEISLLYFIFFLQPRAASKNDSLKFASTLVSRSTID